MSKLGMFKYVYFISSIQRKLVKIPRLMLDSDVSNLLEHYDPRLLVLIKLPSF